VLKTRILTAVVLLIAFSADLFLASVDVFALVLAFIVAAAAWEWSRLCGLASENGQTAFAALVGLVVLIGLYIVYADALMRWLLLAGFLFWASVPALFYLAPRHRAIEQLNTPLLLLGVFVFLVAAVAIQYLRSFAPHGSSWLLLYALAIVWFMDIGAYFSGRRFGTRKLAPSISPGKTWEGVYGGLAVTALLLLVILFSADWADGNRLKLMMATLLSAGASVVGDLFESRIKRAAGRKDSSQLLPGHGGVLDRVDGVLSAIPVFAFVWAWM
jgi:phosphatidate cytidylyltransferase